MGKKGRDRLRGERLQKIDAVELILQQRYPNAFFPKDSTNTKPLAIGIRMPIVRDNPDLGWHEITEVVKRYTRKTRYLRALATCPDRVNLDGSIFGLVSPSHREYAIQALIERQERLLTKEAA